MSKILDRNKSGVSQLIQSPNSWAIDLWRKGCANHWMPQEVDMSTDIKQWKNNGFITEDGRGFSGGGVSLQSNIMRLGSKEINIIKKISSNLKNNGNYLLAKKIENKFAI